MPNLLGLLLLIYQVSLWYNCGRSLKLNICGPDRKMCIYIENGLCPQFFETQYITVFTVGGKSM